MRAFLTGSRAYGTPRPDSDVDLVVGVGRTDYETLRALSDVPPKYEDGYYGGSLRFGKLNLICCTDAKTWKQWLDGTVKLIYESPVTRDRAKEVFAQIRAEDTW